MKFDVIVIGGGKSGFKEAMDAANKGQNCALLSEGRSLDKIDYDEFTKAGGSLLMGDSAESAIFEGNKVTGIKTHKLEATVLSAELYILATGRFFSKGLSADMDSVRETVMGLDLDFDAERDKWFKDDFFDAQPFMEKGVVTDKDGHPFKGGEKIINVKVVGTILSKSRK